MCIKSPSYFYITKSTTFSSFTPRNLLSTLLYALYVRTLISSHCIWSYFELEIRYLTITDSLIINFNSSLALFNIRRLMQPKIHAELYMDL